MIYLLLLLLAVSLGVNVYLAKTSYKLARIVLNFEESLEDCLDGLDEVYAKVGKVLQSPLASDDPHVIQIHKELKRAHGFVLTAANILTENWQGSQDSKE